MKKNSYRITYNLLSLLIFLFFLVYVGLLIVFSNNILQSCIRLFFYNSSITLQNLGDHLFLLDYVIAIFVTAFLWLMLVIGILKAILSIIKTNSFVNSLYTAHLYSHNEYFVVKKSSCAFVFGFVSPKIFIGEELIKKLSQNNLDIVINHEYFHKKNFDPFRKLFFQTVFTSIPLINFRGKFEQFYEVISERAADEYTKEKLKIENEDIVHTINGALNIAKSNTHNYLFSHFFLVNRIELLTQSYSPRLLIPIVFLIMGLVLLCSVTVSAQHNNRYDFCSNIQNCKIIQNVSPSQITETLPQQCKELLYTPTAPFSI